jgi:arylsulfatase A-like enzyme
LPPHRPPSWNEGGPGRNGAADKPAWLRRQGPLDAAGVDAIRIRQLESLRSVDDAVAAILQKLRETGQDANTIIVYYGDNGFLWGEHGRDRKSCPYDECLRVPFVVRYPALAPRARTENAPVLNIDLAPTFAALAGLDPAVLGLPFDGRSLEPLLDGTETAWRTELLGEHWGHPPEPETPNPIPTFALVRGPRWKYIEYCTGEIELYELTRDPFELTNVASSHPEVVESQATRLRELNEEWPATIPFPCGVYDFDEDDE